MKFNAGGAGVEGVVIAIMLGVLMFTAWCVIQIFGAIFGS